MKTRWLSGKSMGVAKRRTLLYKQTWKLSILIASRRFNLLFDYMYCLQQQLSRTLNLELRQVTPWLQQEDVEWGAEISTHRFICTRNRHKITQASWPGGALDFATICRGRAWSDRKYVRIKIVEEGEN